MFENFSSAEGVAYNSMIGNEKKRCGYGGFPIQGSILRNIEHVWTAGPSTSCDKSYGPDHCPILTMCEDCFPGNEDRGNRKTFQM
jgi:hypothetical protein